MWCDYVIVAANAPSAPAPPDTNERAPTKQRGPAFDVCKGLIERWGTRRWNRFDLQAELRKATLVKA